MSPNHPHAQFFVAARLKCSDANPHLKLRLATAAAPTPPPTAPPPTAPVEPEDPAVVRVRQSVTALRSKLCEQATPLTDGQQRFCTDEMLVRYLAAYPKSVDRAHGALLSTLKWRAERSFDDPSPPRACRYCSEATTEQHCFFSIGQDVKNGWEVIYTCPSRSALKDPESAAHKTFIELERAFERSPKFLMLVDLHGLGMRDLDPRTAVYVTKGLLWHYPERIGAVALLDAPWLFTVTWEMLKQLCDEQTAAKAQFLRGDAMASFFQEWLTPEQATFANEVLQLPGRPGSFPDSLSKLTTSRLPQHALKW